MKTTRLLSTTALIMTLALSGAAYAQNADMQGQDHPGWEKMHQHREELLAQLPPEKAKLFKDAMKQAHEKNEATHDQIKKLHKEKDAILTADKFDKDAYMAKTAELDKLYDKMRARRDAAFISVASQFTADERKVLAKMHEGPKMMHDGKEMDHKPSSN